MSIRLIARDLYRLQKEVERLEKELADTPLSEQAPVKDQLRKRRAERDRLRGALEGAKEEPPYRKPR
jgi:hypothetical protein